LTPCRWRAYKRKWDAGAGHAWSIQDRASRFDDSQGFDRLQLRERICPSEKSR
jgi:hypothetical protein